MNNTSKKKQAEYSSYRHQIGGMVEDILGVSLVCRFLIRPSTSAGQCKINFASSGVRSHWPVDIQP